MQRFRVMINSVNIQNISNISANNADNKTHANYKYTNKKVSFGYSDESHNHPLKDLLVTLTNDLVGFMGVNTALWLLQDFVNGKILVGKINEHFTKKIKNVENLRPMADEMLEKNRLTGAVNINQNIPGQAFFTHLKNQVVVGKDKSSALFHEIGHAIEENNTKLFKWLQRGRGNYTILSLALYTLLSQRPKPKDENQDIGSKLSKSDILIPLLAFSPELITEAKASQLGLKFLKQKLKDGAIEKSLYKNIKKSYLTCFSTYLFIPISIILIDALRNSANNVRQRHAMRQSK